MGQFILDPSFSASTTLAMWAQACYILEMLSLRCDIDSDAYVSDFIMLYVAVPTTFQLVIILVSILGYRFH